MNHKIIIKAQAKINLGLRIIGLRLDGYHEIETVMQQISLADTLLFEPAMGSGWQFRCTDEFLSGEDNLVCRAAELLAGQFGKKLPAVRITLYKSIPVEAGLAGGSSDAAGTLIGLNRYWQLGLDRNTLLDLGSQLGSDVPFCLIGGTALAYGRGEILTELPALPFYWVVLVLPSGVRISTAAAYKAFDQNSTGKPSLHLLIEAIEQKSRNNLDKWFESGFTNTLQTVDLPGSEQFRKLARKIRELGFKPALSGSGPTLFFLTEQYVLACRAAHILEEEGNSVYLCWTSNKDWEWLNV